jgi:hypothetical protein
MTNEMTSNVVSPEVLELLREMAKALEQIAINQRDLAQATRQMTAIQAQNAADWKRTQAAFDANIKRIADDDDEMELN